jgi:hypothetical protein
MVCLVTVCPALRYAGDALAMRVLRLGVLQLVI